MTSDTTPICPLPNIGPCVGERCNFWDPEEGCLGTGICFDAELAAAYTQPGLFGENILLPCHEDQD